MPRSTWGLGQDSPCPSQPHCQPLLNGNGGEMTGCPEPGQGWEEDTARGPASGFVLHSCEPAERMDSEHGLFSWIFVSFLRLLSCSAGAVARFGSPELANGAELVGS